MEAGHDHGHCIETAVARAREVCGRSGLRLTAQRLRVLEIIWESHKPVGAYEVLATLQEGGHRAAPPTVYRAIDFLIEAGLVHRIDSLNAFVGCPEPGRAHHGQFLICSACRVVTELQDPAISAVIRDSAAVQGFDAGRQMLEVEGICNACSADSKRVAR